MGGKQAKEKSSTLTAAKRELLKASTALDDQAIDHWHARFLRDCPTGRLDREKFTELFQKLYPSGKADESCKHAFDTFDANNDGYVDFDEFLLTIAASSPRNLDQRLSAAFDVYDVSGDGLIDKKELANLLEVMYDFFGETNRNDDQDPKKRAAEIISKLDASGDKKISKAEFIAGCKFDPVIRRMLAPNI